MFESYYAAGFISESGEILGFPELDEVEAIVEAEELPESVTEEILQTVEIEGADDTIAGFPLVSDILGND